MSSSFANKDSSWLNLIISLGGINITKPKQKEKVVQMLLNSILNQQLGLIKR